MSFLVRFLIPGRQSSRFSVFAIYPLRTVVQDHKLIESFNNDRGTPSSTHLLSTEAPVSETTIDARALVGGHVTSTSVPTVPVPASPPTMMVSRRVSAAVMALQQNMNKLLNENKPREAVKFFEKFINDGFKEAEAMGLQRGQLPLPRRPAEYQWLQYIQALDRSERVATRQIQSAIRIMRQVGIPPRNAHYLALLKNLKTQGMSYRTCEVIDEMIKSGIRPSTACYEQAIFTCLTTRDLDSTSLLLDSHFRSPNWQMSDAKVGLLLYTKVIAFCATLKRIENALIFMRQMTDLQLEVPVHLLLDVISNAAEVDDTGAVDSLLRDLHNMRVVYTINGVNCHVPVRIDEGILLSVLNCAARTGHTFLADQAWSILKDCMILPFSHEFAHASHTSLPVPEKNQSIKEEDKEENEEEEEEEEEENVEDHAHEEGLEFVKKSDQSGEHWREHCRDLFHDYKPLVESYHAFIEAQAKGGNVERAFEVMLELEEHYPDNPEDLSPAQGLCMLADELAKDANTVDQAYFVLDEWHKAGKKVTVAMLDVIVAACSRMGDANRAFETFEAYSSLGITHRTESYNALMEVCASQRQVEVIMKLLQEMSKAGVKPNVDTYMQIIEGYINNGDTSGIAHALQITRREGFMPTLKVLDKAYHCADRFNDENTRSLIRTELLAAGYRFNLQLRRRGGGRGMRGRGGGGGFNTARGSPYPRGEGDQRPRQNYRGPIQTYVGSQRQDHATNVGSRDEEVASSTAKS